MQNVDQSFAQVSAGGSSRQHVGNVVNNNYSYDLRTQRSDASLRGDERNAKLLEAAANGQLPRLRYLLRYADIDFADKDGLTALHHAVMSGSEDCVEEIIAQGSDVDATGIHGAPLNIAAQRQRLRIAVLLFKAKAQQKRALAFAEENGQNIARFLLCARVIAGDATELEALQLCVDESPGEGVQLGTRHDVGVVREQHANHDTSGVGCWDKMHKVQKSKHDEERIKDALYDDHERRKWMIGYGPLRTDQQLSEPKRRYLDARDKAIRCRKQV